MISSFRTASGVRRWATGVSLAGAAVAAAMIGSVAHADTPDDVMDQAIQVLMQGTSVLDAAPTADLGAQQAEFLAHQATAAATFDPLLTQIASAEDGLSAADQTFLATADEQFVTAAQGILSADQAFVLADQAGQLSGSGFLPADLPVIEADVGLLSADFDVLGAVLLTAFDPDLGSLFGAFDPGSLLP